MKKAKKVKNWVKKAKKVKKRVKKAKKVENWVKIDKNENIRVKPWFCFVWLGILWRIHRCFAFVFSAGPRLVCDRVRPLNCTAAKKEINVET